MTDYTPTTDGSEHIVVVAIEDYHGMTATLKCADHEECGYPEAFSWDQFAAMESYHGDPITFEIPAKITGCDEESGIEWTRDTRPTQHDRDAANKSRAEALRAAASWVQRIYPAGLIDRANIIADLHEWAKRAEQGIQPNGREYDQ